jgi:hypothetical protein
MGLETLGQSLTGHGFAATYYSTPPYLAVVATTYHTVRLLHVLANFSKGSLISSQEKKERNFLYFV